MKGFAWWYCEGLRKHLATKLIRERNIMNPSPFAGEGIFPYAWIKNVSCIWLLQRKKKKKTREKIFPSGKESIRSIARKEVSKTEQWGSIKIVVQLAVQTSSCYSVVSAIASKEIWQRASICTTWRGKKNHIYLTWNRTDGYCPYTVLLIYHPAHLCTKGNLNANVTSICMKGWK